MAVGILVIGQPDQGGVHRPIATLGTIPLFIASFRLP